MKFGIKILGLLFVSLFVTTVSVYAYTQSEIGALYNPRITKIETQRDTNIQELEKIYNESISRVESNIQSATNTLNELKTNYAISANICTTQAQSSGLILSESEIQSLIRNCTKNISGQITTQENTIAELNGKISSIRNEKGVKISQTKNSYTAQINALISERDSLIQQIKENETKQKEIDAMKQSVTQNQSSQTTNQQHSQSATTSTYQLPNNQDTKKIVMDQLMQSCQSRLGSNATIQYGACVCKTGYEVGGANICITKAEWQKEQDNLSKVLEEMTNESNSQVTTPKTYSYEKTVKEFKKSKLLVVDTEFKVGTKVSIYKAVKNGNGTRDSFIATVKVGKNGKVTYRLSAHGKYKIMQ